MIAQPSRSATDEAAALAQTRAWVEHVVIGLNLCPFAKGVQARGQVRYVVSDATDEAGLLVALLDEMELLARSDSSVIDTTLLVHPRVLNEFDVYNRFLGDAEGLLCRAGFEGVLQIASFHPDYCFADTARSDVSNATNRSPYPMLHLLREASVARAVAAFPDGATVYEANIRTLRGLGRRKLDALLEHCRAAAPPPASDAGAPTA